MCFYCTQECPVILICALLLVRVLSSLSGLLSAVVFIYATVARKSDIILICASIAQERCILICAFVVRKTMYCHAYLCFLLVRVLLSLSEVLSIVLMNTVSLICALCCL